MESNQNEVENRRWWWPERLGTAHYIVGSMALVVLAALVAGIYESVVIAIQRA